MHWNPRWCFASLPRQQLFLRVRKSVAVSSTSFEWLHLPWPNLPAIWYLPITHGLSNTTKHSFRSKLIPETRCCVDGGSRSVSRHTPTVITRGLLYVLKAPSEEQVWE